MTRMLRRATPLIILPAVLAAAVIFRPPTAHSSPTTAPAATARLNSPKSRPAVPASRGGADLVGTKMPSPAAFGRWLDADGNRPPPAGQVTLYRWWTDTCPFCAASLPAIEGLRQRYGPRGFRVVAVYHPKPPRHVPDEQILAAVKRIGYAGPLATDDDWAVLRGLWLSTGRREATSASFLVDADGVIRYVHPGPDLFPSEDAAEARQNADYKDLGRAIEALLAETPATTRPAQ